MGERDDVVDAWTPPPLDDCDEHTVPVPLDATNRITMRRVLWREQLVGYAIIHSRRVGDRWLEMMMIDTFHHGCVHRHDGEHGATPYKEILPITCQEDIQRSFADSYDDVYNHYLASTGQEYLR